MIYLLWVLSHGPMQVDFVREYPSAQACLNARDTRNDVVTDLKSNSYFFCEVAKKKDIK